MPRSPDEIAAALVIVAFRDAEGTIISIAEHGALVRPKRAEATVAEWRAAIASAIEEAVASERAACLALVHAAHVEIDEYEPPHAKAALDDVERAIRARSDGRG